MPAIRHVNVKDGNVLLLIGSMKGASLVPNGGTRPVGTYRVGLVSNK